LGKGRKGTNRLATHGTRAKRHPAMRRTGYLLKGLKDDNRRAYEPPETLFAHNKEGFDGWGRRIDRKPLKPDYEPKLVYAPDRRLDKHLKRKSRG
jgi:hypothetical protein